jgi:branched-chain amino acid transport system substrate-binding protein
MIDPGRGGRLAAVIALAAGIAGCGSDAVEDRGEGPVKVYVSAPLSGERSADGRDIADGTRLALDEAGGKAGEVEVETTVLDDSGGGSAWDPVATAANARRAIQDSATVGYIGELDSGATRTSLPISNDAEIAQVSPGSTAVDLTRSTPADRNAPERYQPSDTETFARVIPNDDVAARAVAGWAADTGARRVSAEATDDRLFARNAVAAFESEAQRLDIEVAPRADLSFIAGEAEGMVLRGEGERAVSPALAPEQLPPAGQQFVAGFRQRFGRAPGPYAAYGYEAMALVLDAIDRAAASDQIRRGVTDAILDTSDRDSVLGTYSITGTGDTTLDAVSGYRIDGGRRVPDRSLRAPAP